MSERIRILCISPNFAPMADAEAFCGAKMVKALIDFGVDVTVMVSSNFNKPALSLDPSSLWHFTRDIATDIPLPLQRHRFRSLRATICYQSFFARWLDEVVRLAKRLHREHKFRMVYSRSWPMAAHAAGYWCSRALGLPWVANTNDPWDKCFWPGLQGGQGTGLARIAGMFWLKRTLRHAQLLMFPSERLANFHFSLAGTHPAAVIIPHIGCDKRADDTSDFLDARPFFNLVHTGKLGTAEISGRSARSLFAALAGFLASTPEARPIVRLLLVGPVDKQTQSLANELGLREQVAFVGPVSYEKSLNYMSRASVCVLLEAKMDEGMFLPSKLVDYISVRRPILALSPGIGVAADMAAAGELLRVDPDDASAIQAAITSLYSDFQRGTLHCRAPREAFARQFEPVAVAGQFMGAVSPLLKSSRQHFDAAGIAAAS